MIRDLLIRAISPLFYDHIPIRGKLRIRVWNEKGELIEDYTKKNAVTALGDAHVADQLASAPDNAAMSYMAVGSGTGGTTALNTEIDNNACDSYTQGAGGADNDVIYVASFTSIANTVTEAGIFNAASLGVMFVYNDGLSQLLTSGDTLQITWTVTFGAS